MTVTMAKATKIIASLQPSSKVKVGFKLEAALSMERALKLAADQIKGYGLSLVVLNDLAKVDQQRHEAILVQPGTITPEVITGKRAVAQAVAVHVDARLMNKFQPGL
jgi:hypothetical protein